MIKRCLFDGRNPEAWSKADRRRGCERAIVSHRWPVNPFGITPNIEVMPSLQPGILYFDGKPSDAAGYNGRLAAKVSAVPDGFLLNGRPLSIWKSDDGRQELRAFDITNLAVMEAWQNECAASFLWANGYHADYFTSLAWLRPDAEYAGDKAFWRAWDTAYAFFANRFPTVIGQQYHLTPITPYAYGLFVEVEPHHFAQTLDQHRANMAKHGGGIEWVFEIREPMKHSPAKLDEWLRFIKERGCYVSWGRDATAGVGLTEAMERAGV